MKYNRIPGNIPISPPANSKNIAYDTKKIWTEYQILNRLLYRSRNQHKASIPYQHLKEVKRIGERIGKLELWLKANFNFETDEKTFDFLGFLNTLRLLIEKDMEACRKTFYFYCHYLDQALFVTLALVVIGSLATLHSELMQWNKYICILYNSEMEKLLKRAGKERVVQWCQIHKLEERITTKIEPTVLKPPKPEPSMNQDKNQPNVKIKLNNTKPFQMKKSKSKSGGSDEIDDIFNSL